MDNSIKQGDVVELKSGGPEMTVNKVKKDASNREIALCKWFDTSNQLQEGRFRVEILIKLR